MKIVDFEIEGFGVLYGYKAEELCGGINLFYGPNEAGKSTLKDFIVASLFSLPRSNSREYHQPLYGGRHGGRLKIKDENNTVINIECFAKRSIRNSDGKEIDQVSFSQMLGGLERKPFTDVFAFGLSELNDLKSLTTGEVSEMLFNATILGAGASATKVDAELNKELGGLWSTRRRDPSSINDTLAKIGNLNKELRVAESRQKKITDIQKNIDEIDKAIFDLKEQEKAVGGEIHKWQVLKNLKAKSEQNRIYTDIDCFLDQTSYYEKILPLSEEINYLYRYEAKYTSYITDLNQLKKPISAKESLLLALKHETTQIHINPDQAPGEVEIKDTKLYLEDLKSNVTKISNFQDDVDNLQREVENHEIKIKNIVNDLQLNAIPEYLNGIDISLTIAHLLSPQKLVAETDNVGNAVIDSLYDPQTRGEFINGFIANYSVWLNNIGQLLRDMDYRDQTEGKISALKLERISADESLKQDKSPGIAILFLVSAAFSLFSALTALIRHNTLEAALSFLAFLSALFGVYLLLRAGNKKHFTPVKDSGGENNNGIKVDMASHLADLAKSIDTATEEKNTFDTKINDLSRKIHRDNAHKAELEKLQKYLDSLFQKIESIRNIHDAIGANKNNVAALNDRITDMKSKNEKIETRLYEIAAKYGIDSDTRPESLPDALDNITKLLTAQEEYRELAVSKSSLETYLQDFESKWRETVFGILEIFNQRDVSDIDLESELKRKYGDSFRIQDSEYNSFRDFVAGNKNAKELLDAIRKKADGINSVTEIREDGGYSSFLTDTAKNLNALLSTAEHWKKSSEEIERALKESERQIQIELESVNVSEKEYADYLNTESDADEKLEDLKSRLEKITTEKEDNQGRKGQNENELKSLASSQEIADIGMQLENQKARLENLLRKYLTYSFAKWTLKDTLRHYEEEKQPDILKRAGEMFSLVTDNKYSKVFAVTADNAKQERILLVSDGQSAFSTENLSQGAKEQLYLCLRIAYAENFAKYGKTLPFIFDDILVNFDPERGRQAVRLLSEVARERQVISFTCHDYIKDLFLEASEGQNIKVFSLPVGA